MNSSKIDFLHWHPHQSSVCETEKSTVSKFSRTHFHELQAFNSDDTKDINRVEEFNPSFQFLLHLMGKFHFRCFQVSAVLIPKVFRDECRSYDYMDSQLDINVRVRARKFSGRLNYLKKMKATLMNTVARSRETF
ncbi:uncharacterized protein [Solanum tuberosum]|uniref:uncharacterized protein n=1 Tax=Solanum tuberosum TaxID=4113 RepID=UPI0003D28013|nr:PREDICTED: uncharacterized protein LOC102591840 [Solanum tuberosum]